MRFGGPQSGNYPPRQLPPEDTIIGILYGVYDLGTVQEKDFDGNAKAVRKVRLQYELPTEIIEDGEYKGKPLGEGIELTFSFHEKANLRKHAEALRGKKFSEAEALMGIDPKSLLGKACSLTFAHKVAQTSGKKYAKIVGVAPLMRGVPVPTQVNASKIFGIDDWDQSVLDSLPKWIQGKIYASPEARALGKLVPANAPQGHPPAGGGEEETPF